MLLTTESPLQVSNSASFGQGCQLTPRQWKSCKRRPLYQGSSLKAHKPPFKAYCLHSWSSSQGPGKSTSTRRRSEIGQTGRIQFCPFLYLQRLGNAARRRPELVPKWLFCSHHLTPAAFTPLDKQGLTWLRGAGFIKGISLTRSYSDFRNKRSTSLIIMPGVNRASDILRNAPST